MSVYTLSCSHKPAEGSEPNPVEGAPWARSEGKLARRGLGGFCSRPFRPLLKCQYIYALLDDINTFLHPAIPRPNFQHLDTTRWAENSSD